MGNLAAELTILRSRRLAGELLVLILSVVYGFYIYSVYQPYSFLAYDPGWQATVVSSIVEDGDLDLRNQLNWDPKQAGDQTAQGINGEWFPVHEWLEPLVSVPFYLAFGPNGLLVVNVLTMLALCGGSYLLAARFASVEAAFLSALLFGLTPACIAYSYSYSIDVFGAALAIWGVILVLDRKGLPAGLVMGFAVLGRTANATIALLCSCYAVASWRQFGVRRLVGFACGATVPAYIFLFANNSMFGAPFTVSYARFQDYVSGSLVSYSQTGSFSLPATRAFFDILVTGEHSLFVMHPLGFLGLLAGWKCLQGRFPEKILLISVIAQNVIMFTCYQRGFPGSPGNRYLFVTCSIAAVPLASWIDSVLVRYRRRRQPN